MRVLQEAFKIRRTHVAFNLYRSANGSKPVRLNQQPLVSASSMVDEQADLKVSNSYFVRPVVNGREQAVSASFTLAANGPVRQYLSIPLKTPEGYSPNDASVGDLNGDGEYEIVVHQVARGRDNSQAGTTTEPILEAYQLDGTMLWRINLGRNIREGGPCPRSQFVESDSLLVGESGDRVHLPNLKIL